MYRSHGHDEIIEKIIRQEVNQEYEERISMELLLFELKQRILYKEEWNKNRRKNLSEFLRPLKEVIEDWPSEDREKIKLTTYEFSNVEWEEQLSEKLGEEEEKLREKVYGNYEYQIEIELDKVFGN